MTSKYTLTLGGRICLDLFVFIKNISKKKLRNNYSRIINMNASNNPRWIDLQLKSIN